METVLMSLAYLVASVLFILSLRGLSSQESAQKGNAYGMAGMVIAVAATISYSAGSFSSMGAAAIGGGALIGWFMSSRVAMTAMPELVALLHSFVGAAAVIVGFASYVGDAHMHPAAGHGMPLGILLPEIFVDVFIGSLTFTGSVIAFFKLRGTMSGRPLLLPGRHLLNIALVVGSVVLFVLFYNAGDDWQRGIVPLAGMAVISGVLGMHLVMAIGGADMPVVVSMLNSYSGWTASAAGFMLGNDLLIVTGALVGSSGAILSVIMCKAMNRSIVSVIFGGFGSAAGSAPPAGAAQAVDGEITETDIVTLADKLLDAREIVIIPGYGLAVARAQHTVRDMTKILRDLKIKVRFGIHPVAGRLPGHMNVLLAEANLPYDIVLEMDEINADLPKTDVCLVIGANDIVNPGAQTDVTSPIYGMPVLEAWKSDLTVVFKRSRRTGYAGVDNPLFYNKNNRMLFGDAKDTLAELVTELRKRQA